MRWISALQYWLTHDRIRASPREGKLLRLSVGSCVKVNGILARVVGRRVEQVSSSTSELRYNCQAVGGLFDLRVRTTTVGSLEVFREEQANITRMHEQDVEVFG